MSIIEKINHIFRIDTYAQASSKDDIDKLIKSAEITIPNEYLNIIRHKTELEICINNQQYIRIWGATGCMELNDAYCIQKYIPESLAIGDDESGNAIMYAYGKNGFGIYMVAFNDLDKDELVYISSSLERLLIYADGVENIFHIFN